MHRSCQNRIYSYTLILLILILPFFSLNSAAYAQGNSFPEWMDKVNFSPDPAMQQSPEPAPPIDPSTGQPSDLPEKSKKFGKPKLPDFSKLREKAIKSELERKAQDDNQLEQTLSGSIKNAELLKKHKTDLEALLATAAGESDRHQLLKAIGETDEKIRLCAELTGIISDKNATESRNLVASLTPDQYRRASEIRKKLFPAASGTFTISEPTSLFPQYKAPVAKDDTKKNEDEEEFLPRPRTYKPGGIKSIYLESKQQQKSYQEEETDD